MSLDALIRTLTQQAEHTAVEQRERTASEVSRIVEEAKRVRNERWEAVRRDSEARYRNEARARLARAQRGARQRVQQARAAFLDGVFERVVAMLPSLATDARFVNMVPDLLQEGLQYVGDEVVTVMCPPVLGDIVKKASARFPNVSVVLDESAGVGVSLRTSQGTLTIDNTLEARLQRMKGELAIEVLHQFDRGDAILG